MGLNKQHPCTLKSGEVGLIEVNLYTLKVFEGMTLEVFHVGAIPPASTGEAKQSGKVRHLSLWSHQICVDALHYHCFPSEAMTTHCFHHFSITVQIGLR